MGQTWGELPCGECGRPMDKHLQGEPCREPLPGYPNKEWLAWHPERARELAAKQLIRATAASQESALQGI